MGAATAEFDDGPALRGEDAARGFGGDHGLENKSGEKICFHQLRFNEWRAHNGDGLIGENGRTFGQRKEIAREAQFGEKIEELGRRVFELRERAKVIDLFGLELEVA